MAQLFFGQVHIYTIEYLLKIIKICFFVVMMVKVYQNNDLAIFHPL